MQARRTTPNGLQASAPSLLVACEVVATFTCQVFWLMRSDVAYFFFSVEDKPTEACIRKRNGRRRREGRQVIRHNMVYFRGRSQTMGRDPCSLGRRIAGSVEQHCRRMADVRWRLKGQRMAGGGA